MAITISFIHPLGMYFEAPAASEALFQMSGGQRGTKQAELFPHLHASGHRQAKVPGGGKQSGAGARKGAGAGRLPSAGSWGGLSTLADT